MRTRNIVTAVIAAAALLATVAGCSTGSTNWYAAGKAFTIAVSKVDTSLLIGPPGILERWCSENLHLAKPLVPAQRPSDTSGMAGQQWMQGCEAGYREDHPDQPVENGFMYGNGTKMCTGSCRSNWYAAGKALAASASQSPGISTPNAQDATEWCADIIFPDAPLPANVEALKAHLPAPGPQSQAWVSGCEAGYNTAHQAASSQPVAPTQAAAPASPDATHLWLSTHFSTILTVDSEVVNIVQNDEEGLTNNRANLGTLRDNIRQLTDNPPPNDVPGYTAWLSEAKTFASDLRQGVQPRWSLLTPWAGQCHYGYDAAGGQTMTC